jgi:hypothetical protein
MKSFKIFGGLFILIFICLVPLRRKLNEYDTQKNGDLVTATITYIPICLGTKNKYFMKFMFAGQIFHKKVGCGFSDRHKVGDTIKLRHSPGTDIFLFDTEKLETEFISVGLLALFGIFCIISGVRGKAAHNNVLPKAGQKKF